MEKNRRQHDKHLDDLEDKVDSAIGEIQLLKTSAQQIHQTLEETVLFLLKKHDTALYSADGTNGICRDVTSFKEKINIHAIQIKMMWVFMSAVLIKVITEMFTHK